MLQNQPDTFSPTIIHSFIHEESFREFSTALEWSRSLGRGLAPDANILFAEENTETNEEESGLEDAARNERDYVRQRLREELGREPTEQELDEWLRQHTEGY